MAGKQSFSKANDTIFDFANEMNGMCMPDDIENLDEVLLGINEMAWIPLKMTAKEWLEKTAKYKAKKK